MNKRVVFLMEVFNRRGFNDLKFDKQQIEQEIINQNQVDHAIKCYLDLDNLQQDQNEFIDILHNLYEANFDLIQRSPLLSNFIQMLELQFQQIVNFSDIDEYSTILSEIFNIAALMRQHCEEKLINFQEAVCIAMQKLLRQPSSVALELAIQFQYTATGYTTFENILDEYVLQLGTETLKQCEQCPTEQILLLLTVLMNSKLFFEYFSPNDVADIMYIVEQSFAENIPSPAQLRAFCVIIDEIANSKLPCQQLYKLSPLAVLKFIVNTGDDYFSCYYDIFSFAVQQINLEVIDVDECAPYIFQLCRPALLRGNSSLQKACIELLSLLVVKGEQPDEPLIRIICELVSSSKPDIPTVAICYLKVLLINCIEKIHMSGIFLRCNIIYRLLKQLHSDTEFGPISKRTENILYILYEISQNPEGLTKLRDSNCEVLLSEFVQINEEMISELAMEILSRMQEQ